MQTGFSVCVSMKDYLCIDKIFIDIYKFDKVYNNMLTNIINELIVVVISHVLCSTIVTLDDMRCAVAMAVDYFQVLSIKQINSS